MAKRDHKRRHFVIDRLQLQLLAITLVYFLTITVILSLAMFGPLIWELNVDEPSTNQAAAAAEFLSLHTRFWPALLATFVALSIHSIATSHRIVGPLYRFRVVFEQIKQGNLLRRVELRRRDFLLREATAFNDMITKLGDRVHRLETSHREALSASAGIEHALQDESIREARVHLVELERALTHQQQQLDAFRIEPTEV